MKTRHVAVAGMVCVLGVAGCTPRFTRPAPGPEAAPPERVLAGPFRAEALTFYFVHPGGPLRLHLAVRADDTGEPRILYRFYDPKERRVLWDYQRLAPGASETFTHNFGRSAPAGVYQIRYAGAGIHVEPKADPPRAFGLAASRCMVSIASEGQFEALWFLVPPDAESLRISGHGITARISDEAGKAVAEYPGRSAITVPAAERGGEVWRLDVSSSRTGDYYRFSATGFPVILCPDPDTARAIGGSVATAADGTAFPHRFQARMHDWIHSLTAEDLALDPEPLDARAEAWLAHSAEAAELLGGWGLFSHISYLIADQDVDPESPDFGRFRTRRNPSALGAVLALDRPYNPYYRHPVIERRLLLSVFQDLLNMRENETWRGGDSNYSGSDALGAGGRYNALYLGARAVQDAELRDLWIEGLTRHIARFPFFRVSAENQTSHWPLAQQKLFEVTGRPIWQRLARDFIGGMVDPERNRFMQTGYQQEAYGPDATYQGLGACCQALYYRMSGDPNAREGLRRIYDFFNHTVAPEPDGRVFGASGFSHRTQGSWANRQYGGGLSYMAGVLPEAAVWIRSPRSGHGMADDPTPEAILHELKNPPPAHVYENSPQVLSYTTHMIGPFFRDFLFPAEPIAGARFPIEATEAFIRNFNDEFLAVRRPGYGFLAYTRGTAPEWVKSRRKLDPENPHDNNVWNAVPGPQFFWTPGYGSLFLSMNWNGDTHQMVRGDRDDGTCAFPDYWGTETRHDADRDLWVMKQALVNAPVETERRMHFAQDRMEQVLVVRALEPVEFSALYEQIPLLLNKPGFTLLFRRDGAWSGEPGTADAFWCGNEAGEGVLVELDRARPMALGPDREFRSGQQVRPVRIALPRQMSAAQAETIEMTYRPMRRPDPGP